MQYTAASGAAARDVAQHVRYAVPKRFTASAGAAPAICSGTVAGSMQRGMGVAAAGGLRLGAAPAVVVDADEHEHRIRCLAVGSQQGGCAFGAAGGGEARALDHAA